MKITEIKFIPRNGQQAKDIVINVSIVFEDEFQIDHIKLCKKKCGEYWIRWPYYVRPHKRKETICQPISQKLIDNIKTEIVKAYKRWIKENDNNG